MKTTSLPIFVSQEQLMVLHHITVRGISILNDSPLAAAELEMLCANIAASDGNAQLFSMKDISGQLFSFSKDNISDKPMNADNNVIPFNRVMRNPV